MRPGVIDVESREVSPSEPRSELTIQLSEQHADFFVQNLVTLLFEQTWFARDGRRLLSRAYWLHLHRSVLADAEGMLPVFRAQADPTLRPWAHPDAPSFPDTFDVWPLVMRTARRTRRAGRHARLAVARWRR